MIDDWPDRLAELVNTAVARRQQAAAERQQLAARRAAGKTRRHREREKTMADRITVTTDRLTRCRYMRRNAEMCSGEALDPQADIIICAKHAARVLALVQAGLARR